MVTLSEKLKLKGVINSAEVKSLYEDNNDTNAYTDAEKTKLAGIASGAEVNVQSDWDAVSGDAQILNKPTVYTTTNSATPPVGAIEGDTWWDSETGEKFIYYNDGDTLQWVQVSNTNNLVLADVGTAAYADVEDFIPSANSENYVQTTGDQSIAGIKTFTTALILPNNSRINGVEHFYQETLPTTRGDGSALVDGDIWYKPGDRVWIRKGIYWVSDVKTSFMGTTASGFYLVVNSASGSLNWRNTLKPPFILETADIFFYCSTQTDSLNYWDITNCSFTVGDGGDLNYYTPQSLTLNDFYAHEHRLITFEANTFLSSPLNYALRFNYTRIGTVGLSGVLSGFINYRSVYV